MGFIAPCYNYEQIAVGIEESGRNELEYWQEPLPLAMRRWCYHGYRMKPMNNFGFLPMLMISAGDNAACDYLCVLMSHRGF